MRLTVLCVGGVKGPLAEAIGAYEERAGRYWRLRTVEVEDGAGKRSKILPLAVREAEARRLLAHLPGSGEVVALTREGQAVSSRRLARMMEEWGVRAVPEVTFLIGGAFGLGEEAVKRSTLTLSLSAMTLPHEMARLVLLEQLYRAGTISRNEPYHKGP